MTPTAASPPSDDGGLSCHPDRPASEELIDAARVNVDVSILIRLARPTVRRRTDFHRHRILAALLGLLGGHFYVRYVDAVTRHVAGKADGMACMLFEAGIV